MTTFLILSAIYFTSNGWIVLLHNVMFGDLDANTVGILSLFGVPMFLHYLYEEIRF